MNNENLFSERHMQAIWLEQKYFKSLRTDFGDFIEVISPGIWNSEAGPDFKKAHFKINGKNIFGDVELHLRGESWYQHKHHLDERYNDVVLHISFFETKDIRSITTKAGDIIPVAYMKKNLTIPLKRIVRCVDLDLYPYSRFVGSGRCSRCFRRSSDKNVEKTFSEAAERRLIQKYEYLQECDKDNIIMVGIVRALGYKNNSLEFLKLFSVLKKYRYKTEEEMFSLGLGIVGFFDEKYIERWHESEKYQRLLEIWKKEGVVREKIRLNQAFIRPINNPIRRIFLMVKMMRDKRVSEIEGRLCARRDIFDLIPEYEDDYWCYHYNFETEKRDKYLTLMGKNLRQEIVVNVFLPVIYYKTREGKDFFKSISILKTSKSRYLEQRFFGEEKYSKVMGNACMQQGMYQLHREFCQHYEASCEGCSFSL